jgi:hypothetical protein
MEKHLKEYVSFEGGILCMEGSFREDSHYE